MLIMITGGQRSGKSMFAERLALSLSDTPVYLATAQVFDDEFRRRVDVHKARRGPQWTTFEEPLRVDEVAVGEGDVVVFDCVTLWATNWFFASGEEVDTALAEMKHRLDALAGTGATLIMVTNEIGLGEFRKTSFSAVSPTCRAQSTNMLQPKPMKSILLCQA